MKKGRVYIIPKKGTIEAELLLAKKVEKECQWLKRTYLAYEFDCDSIDCGLFIMNDEFMKPKFGEYGYFIPFVIEERSIDAFKGYMHRKFDSDNILIVYIEPE